MVKKVWSVFACSLLFVVALGTPGTDQKGTAGIYYSGPIDIDDQHPAYRLPVNIQSNGSSNLFTPGLVFFQSPMGRYPWQRPKTFVMRTWRDRRSIPILLRTT